MRSLCPHTPASASLPTIKQDSRMTTALPLITSWQTYSALHTLTQRCPVERRHHATRLVMHNLDLYVSVQQQQSSTSRIMTQASRVFYSTSILGSWPVKMKYGGGQVATRWNLHWGAHPFVRDLNQVIAASALSEALLHCQADHTYHLKT